MATAAAMIADDHPTLTDPQVAVLRMVVGAKRTGVLHALGDPIYRALERRGFIQVQADRACWVATLAGRAWVREDQARNGGGPRRALPVWAGIAMPGSRWTGEQALTLASSGVDPVRVATAIVVRNAEGEEDDWTLPARRIRTEVPRLAITRDGRRAKVVTPCGSVCWLEIVRG